MKGLREKSYVIFVAVSMSLVALFSTALQAEGSGLAGQQADGSAVSGREAAEWGRRFGQFMHSFQQEVQSQQQGTQLPKTVPQMEMPKQMAPQMAMPQQLMQQMPAQKEQRQPKRRHYPARPDFDPWRARDWGSPYYGADTWPHNLHDSPYYWGRGHQGYVRPHYPPPDRYRWVDDYYDDGARPYASYDRPPRGRDLWDYPEDMFDPWYWDSVSRYHTPWGDTFWSR